MGYCISANQVGEWGELWAIRGYVLSNICVKRVSTVAGNPRYKLRYLLFHTFYSIRENASSKDKQT